MNDNYKFFTNTKCEYYPCHKTSNKEDFNCLFCYCPLYMLGDKCGGNFSYSSNGIKNCTECLIPHKKNNYEYIINKLKEYNKGDKKI